MSVLLLTAQKQSWSQQTHRVSKSQRLYRTPSSKLTAINVMSWSVCQLCGLEFRASSWAGNGQGGSQGCREQEQAVCKQRLLLRHLQQRHLPQGHLHLQALANVTRPHWAAVGPPQAIESQRGEAKHRHAQRERTETKEGTLLLEQVMPTAQLVWSVAPRLLECIPPPPSTL